MLPSLAAAAAPLLAAVLAAPADAVAVGHVAIGSLARAADGLAGAYAAAGFDAPLIDGDRLASELGASFPLVRLPGVERRATFGAVFLALAGERMQRVDFVRVADERAFAAALELHQVAERVERDGALAFVGRGAVEVAAARTYAAEHALLGDSADPPEVRVTFLPRRYAEVAGPEIRGMLALAATSHALGRLFARGRDEAPEPGKIAELLLERAAEWSELDLSLCSGPRELRAELALLPAAGAALAALPDPGAPAAPPEPWGPLGPLGPWAPEGALIRARGTADLASAARFAAGHGLDLARWQGFSALLELESPWALAVEAAPDGGLRLAPWSAAPPAAPAELFAVEARLPGGAAREPLRIWCRAEAGRVRCSAVLPLAELAACVPVVELR